MTYKELKKLRDKQKQVIELRNASFSSTAGKIELVMSLYQSEIHNEEGEIIGYRPTEIITKEEALELLNFLLDNNQA